MNKTKIGIVLLASLIGMLLCSGVASAFTTVNNCCAPGAAEGDPCYCMNALSETHCEDTIGGIWVGHQGCDPNPPYAPCDGYWLTLR